MAEAEEYRLRAQKAMTRGVFSRPDPISAGNYYKRAADAYKACGENRLERLHRIASGDVQLGQDAYAIAAQEYIRAAELAEISDETLARKRQEMHKLYCDAGDAWAQMGEKGRAAESRMKASFGLIMGDEVGKPIEGKALASIEDAIESFVPDPLNRKAKYRKGTSMYENPNAVDPEVAKREALELARQNIIADAFAHEALFKVGAELIKRRHYETALYAFGAGTASLETEGIATVSLGRAYLSETILTLAMGDTVAASQDFQRVHLQNTAYLSSRECALAEDLIRACTAMDLEALDEARSKSGSHRSAMANLDPVLRHLIGEIRVSGRAKKSGESKPKPPKPFPDQTLAAKPAPEPEMSGAKLQQSLEQGFAEMDDIMNEMGLNDDDDDEDDDIDLT
jgi:tetratricopeptide (TPR) repeat protein